MRILDAVVQGARDDLGDRVREIVGHAQFARVRRHSHHEVVAAMERRDALAAGHGRENDVHRLILSVAVRRRERFSQVR